MVACWGQNDFGQTNVPPTSSPFVQVSAGQFYTCAAKLDGTLAYWGDNFYGQAPVVNVTPGTLPYALVNKSYTKVLSVNTSLGLLPPYTFGIISGTLLPSITLDAATGVLSGTPTMRGPFHFGVQARDAHNLAGTRAYTLLTLEVMAHLPLIRK